MFIHRSGPSWLQIGGAVAGMAVVGAAFSSFMNEEKNHKNRYDCTSPFQIIFTSYILASYHCEFH